MRAATCFALLPAASILMALVHHVPSVSGYTYNVLSDAEPSSSDDDSASSSFSSSAGVNSVNNDVVYSLPDALSKAKPGDTIVLANGTYTDRLESYASGEEGSPITIVGGRGAVLQSISPSVHIEHSWITLEGFTVDGFHGSAFEADSFVNKCVEVIGTGENETEAIEGFVMKNMAIQNCGGECVRLKNFVVNANITDNTIQHCGMYDFEFAGNSTTGGKNGEGIYIGTSSNQWTYGEDRCNGNLVSNNRIATYGNECVEMKEGSSGNIVESNVCSNQRDVNSGCLGSRGDSNTFRFNNVSDCEGAGVRLGGWEKEGHQYGQNNSVYGNNIYHVDNGAISVQTSPQQAICDNACEDGSCNLTGNDDSLGDLDGTWDTACPSEAFEQAGSEEDDATGEEEETSTGQEETSTGEEEEETSTDEEEETSTDEEETSTDEEEKTSTGEEEASTGEEETSTDEEEETSTDDEYSLGDDATDDNADDDVSNDDVAEDDKDDKDDDETDAASSRDESRRRRLRGASN